MDGAGIFSTLKAFSDALTQDQSAGRPNVRMFLLSRLAHRKHVLSRSVDEFAGLVVPVSVQVPSDFKSVGQFPDIGRFFAAKW
jgi:hypothetical protein